MKETLRLPVRLNGWRKTSFIPTCPYERIALHDPANMYTLQTLRQVGGNEGAGG